MESGSKPGRIRQLLQRLRPMIGEQAHQIHQAWLIEDAEGRQQIETYLEALEARILDQGLGAAAPETQLIPPESRLAKGEYELGEVLYGHRVMGPFGLREDEWIQHVGIFGRSGAGKSNLGCLIAKQLHQQGKPFLVLDWKRNYRDLIQLPGMDNVEVYTVGRPVAPLSFNPLVPPPGTAPKTWLKKIIEVIAHSYMLGNGVLFLLQQSLDALYERHGVYSGKVDRYPTFRDVMEQVKSYPAKGREAGWLSSALRALSALCFGDVDQVVNYSQNEHLDDLLTGSVILELDTLAQSDKIFFIQALLLWIHHRRIVDGHRENFKHAILIEEAHHVLSNERRSLIGGQSVMEITFREIREFGEALVILDQHPSQIALPALGNTYATFCLNLKHSRDISAMGQAMLLEGDQRDQLGMLEVGQAAVKLQGRIPRPFLIKIPYLGIKKGMVTDANIADRPRSLKVDHTGTRARSQQIVSSVDILQNNPQSKLGTNTPDLNLAMLNDIIKMPDSGIGARYIRLNLSVRQGQKLKARLTEQGLIEEELMTTDKGIKRILRLTNGGMKILDNAPDNDEDVKNQVHES